MATLKKETDKFFINNPSNKILPNLTTEILSNSEAFRYHKSLTAYQSTPIVSLPALAKKYRVGNIYVKDESSRFGLSAFKGLGASYAIHKILKNQPNTDTFCTATDGNHGRAVAWASKLAGKKAVVFVPKNTTDGRIEAIKSEGARVIKLEDNYDDTCTFAKVTSQKEGWQLLQDTSWENYEEIPALIMAGYLTHFQELEDTLHTPNQPMADIVFLQAGVGSWAASAIWYYLNRYGTHRPKIVIVEPLEANGILASFKAGKRVVPDCTYQTIMAGLNCGIPSLNAWEIIKNGTDISIKISDTFAEQAIRALYYPNEKDPRIIAGESGAAGLAGFLALMSEKDMQALKESAGITEKSNILFYNTEGATDLDGFKRIIGS